MDIPAGAREKAFAEDHIKGGLLRHLQDRHAGFRLGGPATIAHPGRSRTRHLVKMFLSHQGKYIHTTTGTVLHVFLVPALLCR